LITNHELPYAGGDEKRWARWLPGHRVDMPRDWPADGERRKTSDGDEIELLFRTAELDPLNQRQTLEIRARLWRGANMVKEEAYSLKENLYFAQEILMLLDEAGFSDLAVEGGYTGLPATADDGMVAFVGRK
jgi:hypothetical protein